MKSDLTLNIAWNKEIECKKLMTKIIAIFLKNHLYTTHSELYDIVKQILSEKDDGTLYLECFNKVWDLEYIFRNFDAEHIDVELLSSLDNLLHLLYTENRDVDNILTILVNKIRNDESKKSSVSEYITRYAETFDLWDKSLKENAERKQNDQSFIKYYHILSDPTTSHDDKYEAAFILSKNLEFIEFHGSQPLVDVIKTFFDEIDLDKMELKKKTESSYSLSMSLVKIPYYVKAISYLGIHDFLEKHRMVLAKTLLISQCSGYLDTNEIKDIYKHIIGNVDENEKSELIKWWQAREDDFMDISPKDIISCITDYGIDALSYKLEEYIEKYTKQQELSHSIAASEALTLISEVYCKWNIRKYNEVFNNLKEDNIGSIKMQCNAIMIEKYQDLEAITWRIKYIEKNVVKSLNKNTGHARSISVEESEMISANPHMFRCFMNIKGNEELIKQMFSLFDL